MHLTIVFDEPTLVDVEELATVHVRCWQEAYVAILPKEYLAGLPVSDRVKLWQRLISSPEVFKQVARVDGNIVGFITCGEPVDGAGMGADGEIYAVYVLKNCQGHKIGRSLMAFAARFWLSKGGRKLVVLFIAANAQAEAFYTSLGGTQVHEGTFELAGMTVPEKAMIFTDLARLAAYP